MRLPVVARDLEWKTGKEHDKSNSGLGLKIQYYNAYCAFWENKIIIERTPTYREQTGNNCWCCRPEI